MQGALTVSGDISGSAVSYNISYSDISSGSTYLCDSIIINSSSCDNGVCSHHFQVTSSSMPFCKRSMHIIVAVFATNIFGHGSKSIRYLSEFKTPRISEYHLTSNIQLITWSYCIYYFFSDQEPQSVLYNVNTEDKTTHILSLVLLTIITLIMVICALLRVCAS